MRKLPWTAFALLAITAAVIDVFAGCGSDNEDIPALPDGGEAGPGSSSGTQASTSSGGTSGDIGSSGGTSSGGTSSGGTSSGDAGTGGIECKAKGTACATSAECCTANCAGTGTKTCQDPVNNACKLPGATCAAGNECCTGTCNGTTTKTCGTTTCLADGVSCTAGGACCSQNCAPNATGGGSSCKTLSTTGKPTDGNPCKANTDCASGWCNGGVCANPSFCTVVDDICSIDAQCCTGFCNKAAGATSGVCKSLGISVTGGACIPAGEACSPNGTCTGANCCSRSCAPSAFSGIPVCQPESGCHMIGDLCRGTTDCCGVENQPGSYKTFNGGLDGGSTDPSTSVECIKATPGAAFGVCDYVSTVCSAAGQLCKPSKQTSGGAMSCSTKVDCCAGNGNQFPTCQLDSNGIPRCTIMTNLNCDAGVPSGGSACASSADCCGNPCIPNPNGVSPKFVCGTPNACRQQGTTCTSNADCCTGLPCAIPAGASTGYCGGTLLPDGGVTPQPPPGTDGGVIIPPPPPSDGGTTGTDGGTGGICSLYGQNCTTSANCCNGVPCTAGHCTYP